MNTALVDLLGLPRTGRTAQVGGVTATRQVDLVEVSQWSVGGVDLPAGTLGASGDFGFDRDTLVPADGFSRRTQIGQGETGGRGASMPSSVRRRTTTTRWSRRPSSSSSGWTAAGRSADRQR